MNLFIRKTLINNYFYILLLILISIYVYYETVFIKHYSKYNINNKYITGIITDYNIDGNLLSLMINGKEKVRGYYYFSDEKEKIFYAKEIKYGIKISTYGDLIEPNNNTIPNTFNFKKYLYNKNIFFTQKISKITIKNNQPNIFYQLKNIIRDRINLFNERDYVLTFILGDMSLMDDKVYEDYRISGVTHLFAISGTHINFFALIIMYILKKIKIKETPRYIFVFIFLILYAFLTNYTASILRSALFYCLIAFNKIFYTEISNIKLCILTIVILLLINPFILFDIGFIYSAVTCIGLIISSKYIKHKNPIINLFKVSFIAFLFSLPITLINFYEINTISFINNMFFVPYITMIVYPISLIIYIISPLEFILILLIDISEFIAYLGTLTSINIIIPKISFLIYILYYYLIINFVKEKKYCLLLATLLLISSKILVQTNNQYEIYFLDVNQADAVLIRSPNNQNNIMIDVGGKLKYKQESWQIKKSNYQLANNLIIFYKSLGIEKINTIITTHGDEDHMGETINLVNNFKVDNIIFNVGNYNDLELDLINVLKKKKIPYYQNIESLIIGKNKMFFLNTKDYNDENENSSVIYTEINNTKLLFMGDAGVEREKDIINKYNLTNIDVLKVGHHGSNTSSSKYFIDSIKPKVCLISVGKNNRYGHPKESVIDTLDDYCNIYRTDLNGSVKIKLKNNNYEIKTISP